MMGREKGQPPALDIFDLYVQIGRRPVIRGLTLTASPGEFVAIIGPNGVGKTSLVRAIVGLLPAQGHIAIHGRPLESLSPRERARSMSYLPQGGQIHWPLTVRELVALGRLPFGGLQAGI